MDKALSSRHFLYIKNIFSLRFLPFRTCLRGSTTFLTVITSHPHGIFCRLEMRILGGQKTCDTLFTETWNLCLVSFSPLRQCVISDGLFFFPDSSFITNTGKGLYCCYLCSDACFNGLDIAFVGRPNVWTRRGMLTVLMNDFLKKAALDA